jgi:hypothetical protein
MRIVYVYCLQIVKQQFDTAGVFRNLWIMVLLVYNFNIILMKHGLHSAHT